MDPLTGEVFGTIDKSTVGSVVIDDSKSNAIQVLKSDGNADFTLTNYPNPVEGVSTINYAIPSNGHVVLKLYDALGNEVRTIVNGNRKAGEHTVDLNATQLAAGRYICKLTAGSFNAVHTITVIK